MYAIFHVHAPVWLIVPCVIIRLPQLAFLTAAKMCDSFFWSLLLGLTKILCAQALAGLYLLENSCFPHLDRIAARRIQEECPELHTFLAAAAETGQEPSLTVVGFNHTDLSRSNVLNTSLYWLQTPRTWLPAQAMWTWALCFGWAESWISSLAGWAPVCGRDCSTLHSMGWNGSLIFIVIWTMKPSCKPSLRFASFSVSCSATAANKAKVIRRQKLSALKFVPNPGLSINPVSWMKKRQQPWTCTITDTIVWFCLSLLLISVFSGPS